MFGYYHEFDPGVGMPDSWGPLPDAFTYTGGKNYMGVHILNEVEWVRSVSTDAFGTYTINTDHRPTPTVWFVTYNFKNSRQQTDIFHLLFPDDGEWTDGWIRQCLRCGKSTVFTEPWDDTQSGPVDNQDTDGVNELCRSCYTNTTA